MAVRPCQALDRPRGVMKATEKPRREVTRAPPRSSLLLGLLLVLLAGAGLAAEREWLLAATPPPEAGSFSEAASDDAGEPPRAAGWPAMVEVSELAGAGLDLIGEELSSFRISCGEVVLEPLAVSSKGVLREAGAPLKRGDHLVVWIPPPRTAPGWAWPSERVLRLSTDTHSEIAGAISLQGGGGEGAVALRHRLRLRRIFEKTPPMSVSQDPWCWLRLMSTPEASTARIELPGLPEDAEGASLSLTFYANDSVEGRTVHVLSGRSELGEASCASAGFVTVELPLPKTLAGARTLPVDLELAGTSAPGSFLLVLLSRAELQWRGQPQVTADAGRISLSAAALSRGLDVRGFDDRRILAVATNDRGEGLRWLDAGRARSGRFRLGAFSDLDALPEVEGDAVQWVELFERDRTGRLRVLRGPDVSEASPAAERGTPYLIVAWPEARELLAPLRERRAAQGFAVSWLDPAVAFATGADGTHSAPALAEAIRARLGVAAEERERAPHVLLVGPSSYDPDGHLNDLPSKLQADSPEAAWLLPTFWVDTSHMVTASDTPFGDRYREEGGVEAFAAVGRLPATTPRELERMVEAILAQDAREPEGERRALLLADVDDGALRFLEVARSLAPHLAGYAVEEVHQESPEDVRAFAERLGLGLGKDPDLVVYVGHGSITTFGRGRMIKVDEIEGLTGGEGGEVFVALNCLNAYFGHPSVRSLAEHFLLAEEGRSAAFLGSTTFAPARETFAVAGELLRELVGSPESTPGTRPSTLGEALLRVRQSLPESSDVRETLVLLGDPATHLP